MFHTFAGCGRLRLRAKYYLRRTLGESIVTYEELTTLLAQIEACMNSRLVLAFSDSHDPSLLSPAHFLIGEVPTNLPDNGLSDLTINRLSRWPLMQQFL
jgi:hypothetical protein